MERPTNLNRDGNMGTLNFQRVMGVAVLSVALVASAAEPDERRPRRGGPPPPDRRAEPPRGGMPLERVLSEEQRQDLRELLRENQDDIRDLSDRIRKAREEFDEAMFSEKPDEKLLKKKASALAKLEAERHLMHARAVSKIRPSLSREQIERFKHERERLRNEMRSRFEERRDRRFESDSRPPRREARRRPPGFEGQGPAKPFPPEPE